MLSGSGDKLKSLIRATVFGAVAILLVVATGPVVGLVAAITGTSRVPVWAYSAALSALLLVATILALRLEGSDLESLGLIPKGNRIREFSVGLVVGASLFSVLALVRGATVGAAWTFAGWNILIAAGAGLAVAFLLLLPEELVFRGYAFQRLVRAVGRWPGIVVSALLFGAYHLAGSGMWGMGAFFTLVMPACGGIVFGWAAVRTKGLALPIGLHLGGNWVQASVFSFRPSSDAAPAALWTAYITDTQQRSLYASDLGVHLPFLATLLIAAAALHLALKRPELNTNARSVTR